MAHDVPLAVTPFAAELSCCPPRRVLHAHRHGGGRIGEREVTGHCGGGTDRREL